MKWTLNKTPFYLLVSFTVVVIQLFTLQKFDLSYDIGLDQSVRWIFNQGLSIPHQVVFTYGPFLPLVNPIGDHVWWAMAYHFVTKILIVLLLLKLEKHEYELKRLLLPLILAFALCYFSSGLQYIILVLFLSLLNHLKRPSFVYLMLASLSAAIAFYMATYTLTISMLLMVVALMASILLKHHKKYLIAFLLLPLLIISFWFFLDRPLNYFDEYFLAQLSLVSDNSAAVAYYPPNEWMYLGGSLFMMGVMVFLNLRQKSSWIYLSLAFVVTFASWKHGLSREDHLHAQLFISNFILIAFIGVLFLRKLRFINVLLILSTVYLYHLNLINTYYYSPPNIDNRLSNAIAFLSSSAEIIDQSEQRSLANISASLLPERIKEKIGQSTVDLYPWFYTQVPANQLNWKARPLIQSYAAYTPFLDQLNTQHFSSAEAPEFLVWKIDTPSGNFSTVYNSIDNRNLLNDEPQTLLELIKGYELKLVEGGYHLYQKRATKIDIQSLKGEVQTSTLNEWNNIPQKYQEQVSRIHLTLQNSWIRSIKRGLYKDEQFWIQYQLKDGRIHQNRIVPKTAENGLWLNPLLSESYCVNSIESFRIIASNESILNSSFQFQFESLIPSQANAIQRFLNQQDCMVSSIGFKQLSINNASEFKWTEQANELNNASYHIPPQGYSPVLQITVADSVQQNLKCYLNFSLKVSKQREIANTIAVVELWQEGKKIRQEFYYSDFELVRDDEFNWITAGLRFNNNYEPYILKAYLWNFSSKPVDLNQFKFYQLSINGSQSKI